MGWTINQTPAFLVLVHVMGGLVWSGYNVSSLNYALETSSDQERTKLVGVFNAFAGVGIFLGSLTGGLIAPHVPQIFAYSILTLILISGILRFGTGILLLLFVHEVREGTPPVRKFHLHVPRPAFAGHRSAKLKS
jgi:MFS family permease